MTDPHPDTVPEDLVDTTTAAPAAQDDDARSDIEQAVKARADAVERGDGGPEGGMMTDPGEHSGNHGTGGMVRNQDLDQQ